MRALCVLALALLARADHYHQQKLSLTRPSSKVFPSDPAELEPQHWHKEAFKAIEERLKETNYNAVARNVVLFLGDGMSTATLAAARALYGQRTARSGEEQRLTFEYFPVTGLAKTYCVDQQVPDSACTATAYQCGVKANFGTLGVSARVKLADCAASADPSTHVESLAAWAIASGRSAGIVTTTRVTHASPAGAYAHTADRDWENDSEVRRAGADPGLCPDIADQLINHYPGNKFKVILGGGRRGFRPNTTKDEERLEASRWDGRDLIQEWRARREAAGDAHAYVWNRQMLLQASFDPPDYLLGLFHDSHMMYDAEARGAGRDEPSLTEMTAAAIHVLSRNPRGFFLFVEAGRIDHAHHDNHPLLALDETLALSSAVDRAQKLLPATSSLIVVTADHSHVMTYNGYSRRGADVLGASDTVADDGVPYMTLSYANGPGYRRPVKNKRIDVTKDAHFKETTWMTHAEVPLEEETHAGEDVAVFARGPQQQLFTGLYEQSQLPHLMAHAACLGPAAARRAACTAPGPDPKPGGAAPPPTALTALLLTVTINLLF